ncbi:hypothetical protein [Ruegeria arenilitoris]|uniref:hypothetical protein n=1 Tax=Ruegeria arenilitoris TaxID=1173585 RepID=UPI00147CDDF1|nr:hypothetical protein [Ruegeria arenilitoris]
MKAFSSIALAAAVTLGLGGVVLAKPLSRIISETGLSPEDFEVLSATSDSMLASGTPRAGKEREWINESTGSKGTIRVLEVRDNCASLQHFIRPAGVSQTRQIRTRRCRDANGNWILTP